MDRFDPLRSFVHDMDELLRHDQGVEKTVLAVKDRLSRLIGQRPSLPEAARALRSDCYARHLLYQDPQGRYEVVVMAWSSGQQTPVHDHSGIWCVEGVMEGVVDVTRYDVQEMEDGRARVKPSEVIHAGLGECGALIPPLEYHRIANPYPAPAYTMHVYGGRMRTCHVYTDRGDGTYQVVTRELGFSSPEAALPA